VAATITSESFAEDDRLGRRPNVLVIITDQQSAGMMSCAGNQWLKTPNMDRLAAEGVRFDKAYSANPVCVPSRFVMFSGMMPSVIGMEHNGDDSKTVAQSILDNAMGSIFKRAGYRTVYGGKVHLPGQKGVRGNVEAYGFEYISPNDREGRDGLAEECEKFLQQKHDRPFLLVASFMNPHDICYMAINACKKSAGEKIGKAPRHQQCLDEALKMPDGVSEKEFFDRYCPPVPPNFEIPENEPEGLAPLDARNFRAYVRKNWTEKDWRLHRWAYARLTERVDAEIGRVLAALRRAGLEKDTLVVFTSDHGDMDAAHRLEHKSMPYEEAIHVPFIVTWKDVTKAGLVDREHLVSSGLDLIPTICDFTGIPVPPQLKGTSVRRLAEGSAVDHWRKTVVIENKSLRVVHMGGSKYAVYETGSKREQFMDLEKDPGEMKNLACDQAYKPQVEKGRELLKEWYKANGLVLDPKYIVTD
jgi:choline-sulfatase